MQAQTKARLTCLLISSGVKSKFSILIVMYILQVVLKHFNFSHYAWHTNR
jgi:hypothetical protein